MAWGKSGFNNLDDVRKREMIVAGTGAGSETDTLPIVMNELLGTKFKVITGYLGSQQTILAIEGGEVHGRCGFSLSSIKSTKLDWIRDKKINILLQMAVEKSAELPDVPFVFDLVSKPEDKQLLQLVLGPTGMSRAFAGPPNMAPGKTELLRRAFDATMKDPAFLAEAKMMQAEVNPTTGEGVQALVQTIYATPKPVVERAKKFLN